MNDEQMDQVLATYKALTSQTYHSAPDRSICVSFVDMVDNGGLAGSDVRILSNLLDNVL